jgi:hypothetical protein
MNYSDIQTSPVRLNSAFSLLWFLSRLAAARDLKAHLLRSMHPFTRLHPHSPEWKSCATGNFSLKASTGGLPPSFPFSADVLAFRSDFTRPIAAAARDNVFILYLLQNCGPLRFSHDLRGLVAQAIRAAVFFQLFRIGIHPSDSQFRYQPIQFVPFREIHNQSSFGLFALLALKYILSFGLSRIILKNDYERNQRVTRFSENN